MRVIVLATQKGGVGRSTSAVNLAVLLARSGPTLLVDVDAQATATRQLGAAAGGSTVVDVLAGRTAAEKAILRGVHGVDVLAGARDLAGVEMALVAVLGRERVLADALEPIQDRYAHVVIDTPPNLGLLTTNALMCADQVVSPVSAEDGASVQGAVELRATLAKLARLRGGTEPAQFVILTRWDPRRVMGVLIAHTLTALEMPPAVKIPARAAVGQAGAAGVPLAVSAPDSAVTVAYQALLARLDGGRKTEPC